MTVRDRLALAPIEFPVEVSADARRKLLMPLRHSAWAEATAGGVKYRRWVTREQPLYFAFTYLDHWLRNQDTGTYSVSRMHMDFAYRARRWQEPGVPIREATIAPRKAAKSTWMFIILPLWALAHGHRRFLMAFSYTDAMAAGQLDDLRTELKENELLLSDFPDLRVKRPSQYRTVTASGATIAARGLGANTRGARSGVDRPDILLGDDLEPDESKYNPNVKEKVLGALRQVILPMNHRAVVQITGTVTAPNSVAHDLARAGQGKGRAPWIAEAGFDCRYIPPILDEGTPSERSFWEQQFPLSELQAMRGTRAYAMEMANDPDLTDSVGYWDRELIRYDSRLPAQKRVLYIDPATSTLGGRKTDLTAVIQAGIAGRKAVVEFARADRYPGHELRELIWALHERQPQTLRDVYIEDNKGGDRWKTDILTPLPPGVRLHQDNARGAKKMRIEQALSHYQRGAVWHSKRHEQLEDQMLSWTPKVDGPGVDDLVDALAGALRILFKT